MGVRASRGSAIASLSLVRTPSGCGRMQARSRCRCKAWTWSRRRATCAPSPRRWLSWEASHQPSRNRNPAKSDTAAAGGLPTPDDRWPDPASSTDSVRLVPGSRRSQFCEMLVDGPRTATSAGQLCTAASFTVAFRHARHRPTCVKTDTGPGHQARSSTVSIAADSFADTTSWRACSSSLVAGLRHRRRSRTTCSRWLRSLQS
jgi:hypothetical protein